MIKHYIAIFGIILFFVFAMYDYSYCNQTKPNIETQQEKFVPFIWHGYGKSTIEIDVLIFEIKRTLDFCNLPYNENYIKLQLETCAAESGFGKVLQSYNDYGLFQININNEKDIWDNYLKYNDELRNKVLCIYDKSKGIDNLKYNISYQIVLSYLTYYRKHISFNDLNDIWTRSWVWKTTYNTHEGKGTTTHYYNSAMYYLYS